MTDTQYIEAIRRTSPIRHMSKDERYCIRRCCGINHTLITVVDEFVHSPARIDSLMSRIHATPQWNEMQRMCAVYGERCDSYSIDMMLGNLCDVCERVIAGLMPLPTDSVAAIVHEFQANHVLV